MKKILYFAIGIVLCLNLVSAQSLVKEDLFSITFPYEPSKEVKDIETENAGTVQLTTYMYEDSTTAWMIAYSEYPADYMQQEGLLDNAENGFISSLEMEVTDEWAITRDQYNGICFYAEGSSTYCIVKDYIVGNRLYQIAILQSDFYPSQVDIDQFVNSFNLNLPAAGI
jgi:hypothetical protein